MFNIWHVNNPLRSEFTKKLIMVQQTLSEAKQSSHDFLRSTASQMYASLRNIGLNTDPCNSSHPSGYKSNLLNFVIRGSTVHD